MRIIREIFAVVIMLASLQVVASAQNTRAQQDKKARLEREIRELETQIKDNSTKSSNALAKLSLINQKIEARKELIQESDRELKELDDSIAVSKSEADAVQARLDTMTLYYGRLVKNAYKNRDAKVWFVHLLASRNLGQAGRRYAYLRSLSSQMSTQATRIKETKARLEAQLAGLRDMRTRAQSLRDEQQKELNSLKDEQAQSQKIVAQLNKEKSKYQKQLSSKKSQVEALNKEIQKLIAEAVAGDSSQSSKKNVAAHKKDEKPIDYKLSGKFEANKGKLPWPVSGSIADHYGQHYHPVYKSVKLPFNNGVTITVPKGTEAKAVFDGEVRKVIVMPGYNKCVLVQHGSYFTFYCKLSDVKVKAGDKVSTGQSIGVVDTIDGQTQLHFQLWEGSTPRDPEGWLRPR